MLPTNARHRVVLFGMSLAVLAYIDRTVIAQAAPLISAELGFDKVMMGTVLSAFLTSTVKRTFWSASEVDGMV